MINLRDCLKVLPVNLQQLELDLTYNQIGQHVENIKYLGEAI